MITPDQIELCNKYGLYPYDAPEGLKAGVADNVRTGLLPLNDLRHPPQGDTTGWYIWAGQALASDPNFFVPNTFSI